MAKKKSAWEKPASESQAKVASILDEAAPEMSADQAQELAHETASKIEAAAEVSNEDRAARDSQDHAQHPKFDKFKKGKS